MTHARFLALILLAVTVLFSVNACDSYRGEAKYPSGLDRTTTGNDVYGKKES